MVVCCHLRLLLSSCTALTQYEFLASDSHCFRFSILAPCALFACGSGSSAVSLTRLEVVTSRSLVRLSHGTASSTTMTSLLSQVSHAAVNNNGNVPISCWEPGLTIWVYPRDLDPHPLHPVLLQSMFLDTAAPKWHPLSRSASKRPSGGGGEGQGTPAPLSLMRTVL